MMIHVSIVVPLLLPTAPSSAVDTTDVAGALSEPTTAASFRELSELDLSLDTAIAALPQAQEQSLHSSRFTIKGGYYGSTEDALDDGWIANVSWMKFFSSFFALEFEVGYLDADGTDGGLDTEVWGIPIMVNGRLNLPIWVLDLYGGVGIGTLYYDAEANVGNQTAEDDGFLWAGNAFAGATLNLAEAVALGLEFKYYVTDDIDDVDSSLDAYALMLTLGFSN